MNRRGFLSLGPVAFIVGLFGIKPAQAAQSPFIPILISGQESYVFNGPDRTRFAAEPLARTRDSFEYLLKAYPTDVITRGAIYRRLEITALDSVVLEKSGSLDAYVKGEFDQFIHEYYNGDFAELKPEYNNMSMEKGVVV